MLGDIDTVGLAIALALCLLNEKNRRWIKERYTQTPRQRLETHHHHHHHHHHHVPERVSCSLILKM